jgi:hypothetical protein
MRTFEMTKIVTTLKNDTFELELKMAEFDDVNDRRTECTQSTKREKLTTQEISLL